MRQSPLACALAAGIALVGCAGTAQAVNLNPLGTGQVLVFPYYTVNGGNQTLITVVNGTEAGKALKIRFREGRNARTALDFNLYLGIYGVWTGSVFSLSDTGPDNPANLYTTDTSCTVPAIRGNPQLPILANRVRYAPFSNAAYTGAFDDAGTDTLERTREGYFEVFELGEVVDRTHATLAAIRPTGEGVPADCQRVLDAWSPTSAQPYWTANALIDIDPPRGGLYGQAAIIDALGGTMLTYKADAIDGFSDIAQHTAPASPTPSLATARTTADSAVAQVFVDGTVVTSSFPLSQAVDAVSALFVQREIFNTFVTSVSIGGASEWIVTFPTKFAYTDEAIVGAKAIAPFTAVFPKRSFAAGDSDAASYFAIAWFDRDNAPISLFCGNDYDPGSCSWPLTGYPRLQWASSVVSFNQWSSWTEGSTILGSRNVVDIPFNNVGVRDGTAHFTFHSPDTPIYVQPDPPMRRQRMRPDRSGGVWEGLPISALLVESYTNGQLTPGVLSNYAGATSHRGFARYVPAQP